MLEITVLVSLVVLASIVFLAFQCSCFGRSPRFKSFEEDPENQRDRSLEGCIGPELDNTSLVNFEPLPDILSKAIPATTALRPRITCIATDNNDANSRIVAFQQAFPRKQLTYLSEMGMGWFGQVVQGVADNVLVGVRQSNVIVQVLRDDASALEMQKFLQEVAGYRVLDHPNVLRLLGMCTEAIPFLILFEYFPLGDLKSYLIEQENKIPMHRERKLLLHFAVDVACGLACLHRHNYVHCDLALRNCLVTNDLSIKVGDYGLAEDKYKEDYYDTGCDLLPVRWMAPETFSLQKGVWRTKAFTPQANIWSYGVSMWELIQFGRQPFHWLTDEQVLDCVVLKRTEVLPVPNYPENQKINIYELMKMCWQAPEQRPTIEELHGHVLDLEISLKNMEDSDFESKWNILSPVEIESPSEGVEAESMEIATDALELFVAENETGVATGNTGDIALNVPIELPLENGLTIPLASRHLLTFNDSDLVTDINTETEEKLLAQLESETKHTPNSDAILDLDNAFELGRKSPSKSVVMKQVRIDLPDLDSVAVRDTDVVDGSTPVSAVKMKRTSITDVVDGSTPVSAVKMKRTSITDEDGMPSPIPNISPKDSPSHSGSESHLSSERIHDLSSIHSQSDDESKSDFPLEISEEMADIYFQRRSNSSSLRRSNLKAIPLAPIPENGIPVDSFGKAFNKSHLVKSNTDDSPPQDSYEWDELVGGQLMGKSHDAAPSPRRSLDFDWSMDSNPNPKPVTHNKRRRHTLASLPDLDKNSEFSLGKSDNYFSISGTGLNACSIASEILTSRVISPITKKTPPRRTFYTISSLNDMDLDIDDDDDGLEMDNFDIPRSLHLKYSTSQDLTTVGNTNTSEDITDIPLDNVSVPSSESASSSTSSLSQPPPPPAKEAFCEDLLERISSIESVSGSQLESLKPQNS